jgi:hypothetical protein
VVVLADTAESFPPETQEFITRVYEQDNVVIFTTSVPR